MPLELLGIRPIALALRELPPRFNEVLNGNYLFIRMNELRPAHANEGTPPLPILPVLQKLKSAYFMWFSYYPTVPKAHRFTLAQRIDGILIECIEAIGAASFTPRQEKLPFVRLAIRKLDTVKILLLVLWESKSLDTKKYVVLSRPLDEIGRMLGGWHGQLQKQNSPGMTPGEK